MGMDAHDSLYTCILCTQDGPLSDVRQERAVANGDYPLAWFAPSPSRRIAYLKITCGEYQARCECCKTFRSTPEGVLPLSPLRQQGPRAGA